MRRAPNDGMGAVLIAVTGGTGYLGAHTVAALLADGHEVRLLVHPAENPTEVTALFGVGADRLTTVAGDIRARPVVAPRLGGCDALLHAGGVGGTHPRREGRVWVVGWGGVAVLVGGGGGVVGWGGVWGGLLFVLVGLFVFFFLVLVGGEP
uniref:NAD-dependent epimerase/dehydratase family protein n=1 Tax=Nocardia farcinica TaxID=37329 RepID=UPI0024549816